MHINLVLIWVPSNPWKFHQKKEQKHAQDKVHQKGREWGQLSQCNSNSPYALSTQGDLARVAGARQLHQERTQVVCDNKEDWKHLADSNRTTIMDLRKVHYRKVLNSGQSCLYVLWYVRVVDTNLVLKCLFRSEVSVKSISSLQFLSERSLVWCLFSPPFVFWSSSKPALFSSFLLIF